MRFTKITARRLLVAAVLLPMVTACGYSEEEWQAQLDKYNNLNGQFQTEQSEHAATRAKLDEAEQRVADLESQLKKMGFNLEDLQGKLQEEGTEKQKLAANIEQLKQAIKEYQARAAVLERIKKRFEQLREKLQKLTNLGLKVSIRNNRMVISLPGDVLFASGKDRLKDEGITVLKQVADVIRNDTTLNKRYFQVAGHTDNVALKGGVFKDNWGLSAMRGRSVLVYLVSPTDAKKGGGGLNEGRLHAAGYGDTDPIAGNDSKQGRQSNRRVELVLMPDVEEMLDLKSLI